MYRQRVISKNDKFRTFGFHSSSSLNQFTSSNNQYALSDGSSGVCRSQSKPRMFSRPGSHYDRAVVGWALATHPGLFSVFLEFLTALGCSQFRMGVDSQERCAASHAFGSTSLWGSYFCRRWSCLFWTNLTQVNWFRRERDIHSQVKNLSFLKMTPCLNTSE